MDSVHNKPSGVHGGLVDVPLILEDLLCRIAELRLSDGDVDEIADLQAQVELIQGR